MYRYFIVTNNFLKIFRSINKLPKLVTYLLFLFPTFVRTFHRLLFEFVPPIGKKLFSELTFFMIILKKTFLHKNKSYCSRFFKSKMNMYMHSSNNGMLKNVTQFLIPMILVPEEYLMLY